MENRFLLAMVTVKGGNAKAHLLRETPLSCAEWPQRPGREKATPTPSHMGLLSFPFLFRVLHRRILSPDFCTSLVKTETRVQRVHPAFCREKLCIYLPLFPCVKLSLRRDVLTQYKNKIGKSACCLSCQSLEFSVLQNYTAAAPSLFSKGFRMS